jgi:hypothetical protein
MSLHVTRPATDAPTTTGGTFSLRYLTQIGRVLAFGVALSGFCVAVVAAVVAAAIVRPPATSHRRSNFNSGRI